MPSRPRVLVAIRPSLYQLLFPADVDGMLREFADVTFNTEEREWDSAELARQIANHDAVITGWGTPVFTDAVLDAANRLRLIAHSAGTIKRMLPPEVFARSIAVTSAAAAIAPSVAEMTLLLIMLSLRKVHLLDRMLKQGVAWHDTKMIGLGQELAGKRVGVVGAGHTGRCVIKLLHALEAEVWVYDPYLENEKAQQIRVQSVTLETLFAECPIVTIQAPPTQETYHMVRAEHLALLADGAILINTARSHIIDQDALLAELRSGRIQAALDVFDQEPLPADHPYLSLDNVIVTPHVAGASLQARHRQGKLVKDEIRSFFDHEHLYHEVTAAMLGTMA